MARNPDRLCRCHGEPMYRKSTGGHLCYPKLQERWARSYRHYKATPEGQRAHAAANARSNPKRYRSGARHLGVAETIEQAQQIQEHINRRLHAAKPRFKKRAEVESLAAGGISTQASPPAD